MVMAQTRVLVSVLPTLCNHKFKIGSSLLAIHCSPITNMCPVVVHVQLQHISATIMNRCTLLNLQLC